jgi:methyltransferase (TIGR00027 family)
VKQRPSITALAVAFGQLLDAYEPALTPLFVPGHHDLLEASVAAFEPRGPRGLRNLKRGWYRRVMWAMEAVTAPGIFLHYLLRKRFIEDAVRTALADGCTQCIVIGAGLDTLATRLARENAALVCIEVDHPLTQAIKTRALAQGGGGGGGGAPANLSLVAADLRETPLASVLASVPSYDAARPTAFVAEGLLMYLRESDVSALFRSVRAIAPEGSRFVFTFMESDGSGRVRFKGVRWWYGPLLDWWLARIGESMHWSVDRTALSTWAQPFGWHVLDIGTHETFRALYLAPHGLQDRRLLDGEYVAVAE